jgi:adenylate cyclase class IV
VKNFEMKAVAGDFSRLRRALRALGARCEPRPLDQTDWYFQVPNGRLKLRHRKGDPAAEFIFYVRANANTARTSEYQKLPVTDVPGMLRMLRAMFEAGPSVRKRRELWWYGPTRIHLDRVAGLGSFVEIEVPFGRKSGEARRVMALLRRRLGIGPGDLLAESYADMVARGEGRSE